MRYYSVCIFITPDSGAFNLVQLRIEFANMLLANVVHYIISYWMHRLALSFMQ